MKTSDIYDMKTNGYDTKMSYCLDSSRAIKKWLFRLDNESFFFERLQDIFLRKYKSSDQAFINWETEGKSNFL